MVIPIKQKAAARGVHELEVALLDAERRGDVADERVVQPVVVEVAPVDAHALERVDADALGLGQQRVARTVHRLEPEVPRRGPVVQQRVRPVVLRQVQLGQQVAVEVVRGRGQYPAARDVLRDRVRDDLVRHRLRGGRGEAQDVVLAPVGRVGQRVVHRHATGHGVVPTPDHAMAAPHRDRLGGPGVVRVGHELIPLEQFRMGGAGFAEHGEHRLDHDAAILR